MPTPKPSEIESGSRPPFSDDVSADRGSTVALMRDYRAPLPLAGRVVSFLIRREAAHKAGSRDHRGKGLIYAALLGHEALGGAPIMS